MRTIVMQAAANIKKSKTQLLPLVGLVFIAALFLNLGLLFFFNLGSFYDARVKAQDGAHGVAILPKSAYEKSDLEFFENYPGVTEVQAEETMLLTNVEFNYNGTNMIKEILLYNYDAERSLSKFDFIGAHLPADENAIYLPYTLKSGGYGLGDEITLAYNDRDYGFWVAGFVEDIYLGSTISSLLSMYMPDEAYKRWTSILSDSGVSTVVISFLMEDVRDAAQAASDYNSSVSVSDGIFTIDIDEIKFYRTMIPNMISIILVAFSAIIVAICMIVVRFRIITSIQDGMTNIGILKATGNTSNQIIASVIFQYGGITAAVGFLGIAASFFTTPALSGAFAGLIGLDWKQGFDPLISAGSFIAITGTAIAVSVLSAGRIGRLHPVSALRGDISAGRLKRNFFPLEKTPLDLPAALALKDIFQKSKQNLMISLIITGVTFTSMFSVVMYYNFAIDNTSFLNLGMGEPCNVAAISEKSNDSLLRRIERMPEVRKAVVSQTEYGRAVTTVNREKIYPTVMEDFSVSDNTMLLSGKYPQRPDEISFPGVLAKKYGLRAGDIVSVKIGGREEDYVICGITQSLNNSGRMAAMTLSGIKLLLPEFELHEISISLNKYEDTREFIDILKDEYGSVFTDVINIDELIEGQMGTFVSMTVLLSAVVTITSLLVVVLVLYLIVKINISQKRRELGIQKAVGYTTAQLMARISMGFLPVVLFGAAIGGVLSLLYINSVLTVLFGAIGVMKMDFVVRASWAVIMALAITGFSYAVSMFISWRIRKISPYVLAGE